MSRFYRTPPEGEDVRDRWRWLLATCATGAAYGISLNLDGAVPSTSLHEIARTWHLFVGVAALAYVVYLPICAERYRAAFVSSLVLLSVGPGINWLVYLVTEGGAHARGLDLTPGISLVSLVVNGLGVVLLTWASWRQSW